MCVQKLYMYVEQLFQLVAQCVNRCLSTLQFNVCTSTSVLYRYKHVFNIETKERVFFLVAKTQLEMEAWVEALCKVCGLHSDNSKSHSFTMSVQVLTCTILSDVHVHVVYMCCIWKKVCAEQTRQMADSCFGLVGPHQRSVCVVALRWPRLT